MHTYRLFYVLSFSKIARWKGTNTRAYACFVFKTWKNPAINNVKTLTTGWLSLSQTKSMVWWSTRRVIVVE